MAFLSKIGNILRQTANKQIGSELSPFKLSIHQAVRCMSSMASSKLFIGGISYQTDEQSLREAFAKYGEVIDARIISDRETGRSRGFGFVTFTSSEEASSAIQALDGQELHGRRVRVNYATERPRPNFGDGGYSGGGGAYGGGGGGYGGGSGGYGGGSGSYGGGSGGYGGGGSYGGGSGGYGGGSGYGGGNTGGGYGGSGGGYSSGGNYPSGNTFETASTGDGFGNSSNFGVAGGADDFVGGAGNSFGSGGAQLGENKGGFSLDDPLEGSDRDDGDAELGENKGGFSLDDPLEGNDRDDDDASNFLKRS